MKVYEAAANAFVKEGTTAIFGLLGDGNMSWSLAISKYPGVRIIDARHEGAALSMAEGFARATGKVGVCSVTHGPGVSRMTTSLIAATRSRKPVVAYTSRSAFNNERINQSLDQERLVGATGAGYIEVLRPSYAEEAVRHAFFRAKVEARPIVLCFPMDIQGKECEGEGENYQPSSTLYAGQQRIRPAEEQLAAAVKLISKCRKPVVLVGDGAMRSGALEAADRLAQRIGALVTTTLLAKGMLPDCEYNTGIAGLFSTRTAMKLFEESDCVIAIGASLNPHTLEGGYLFPTEARIVQIDVTPIVLMGNDRVADCYVQGDAEVTIRAIEEMLAHQQVSMEGFRTPAVRRALADANRDPAEFEIEPGTVDPREAVRVMDERLPSNASLVYGLGHCFSSSILMRKPRAMHVFANGFGSIGQVLATTVGFAVGMDGDPVVDLEGDGSAMQNIQELDTAARLNLKILFVIMNDEALGAEYQKLRAKGLDLRLGEVRSPDFGAAGRAFGCRGRTARTAEEVAAGVDEFLAGAGPMVLDIRISRNVLSIPYRRMHFGQDA